MPDAGIVIVTYNSGREIGACLDAALACGAEVVVVDNASTDGTRAEVARRGVRLLANGENRGFAAAVNQGIRALTAPLILLLNPDAVLLRGLDALCECCREAGVAGAGGLLVGGDGRPQIGFSVRALPTPAALACEALLVNRLWPGNPVNWHYRCLEFDCAGERDVEQPAGAFLMVRREVWQKLGGFEETFWPLWFEDVDFCRRAAQAGYRFRFTPRAVAKHTGGHSIPKIPLEIRQLYWYRGFLRYAARHFSPWRVRMLCLAVALGSAVRLAVELLLTRSLKPIAVHGKVVRLAGQCMVTGRVGDAAGLSSPVG